MNVDDEVWYPNDVLEPPATESLPAVAPISGVPVRHLDGPDLVK
jgi:hypothetical protein